MKANWHELSNRNFCKKKKQNITNLWSANFTQSEKVKTERAEHCKWCNLATYGNIQMIFKTFFF